MRLLTTGLFFLALIVIVFSSEDTPTDEEAKDVSPLVISSELMDYDTETITVREGRKLMVTCLYEGEEHVHKSDLVWKQTNGNNVDGESNPSLFSIVLNERGSRHIKNSLHFAAVHTRDTGSYTCSAKTPGGEIFNKSITLVVLGQIQWNDSDTEKGALVGEPITVDCGVKNMNGREPMIQMTSGNGEPLDEEVWTIAGNEATIDNLKQEHANMTVSCITIEMHPTAGGDEFPIVDRKDVKVEVYSVPEFEEDESIQYTVIDNHVRNAYVYCNVSVANPPATQFSFYHGEESITLGEKYNMNIYNGPNQGASLKIHNVNQNDLGTYRCEANNIKGKGLHSIHLREANAPAEPKVTLIEAKKHSIIWKVESIDQEPDLPVTSVEIRHLRAAIAEASGVPDEDISDNYWETHSIFMFKKIKEDNTYEVSGLRHGHEYVWRFRQINDAGFGESVVLRAKTFDEHDLELMDSSSASVSLLSLLSGAIIVFLARLNF